MRTHAAGKICVLALVGVVLAAALPTSALAQPVVKTVPWVATNPLIPHDTWSGKSIRLKGTTDVTSGTWTWDFGDGSLVATGAVSASNRYLLEASHTYTGVPGQIFTARLTVASGGSEASANYYVEIRDKTLPVEVNVAIDEGLWYLHRVMYRYAGTGAVELGHWANCSGLPSDCTYGSTSYYGATAANVNAFLVNGHLEGSSASNPYTETVQRAMRQLFLWLASGAASSQTNGLGTFNPDSDGNGLLLTVNQGNPYYQGGMFIDAIVATGTPDKITETGGANVIGRRYRDVVQDLVDGYALAQYDGSVGGGWRYSSNQAPDNSAAQWGAIGLLAAEGFGGVVVPWWVKDWNRHWLKYSQYRTAGTLYGSFGYTGAGVNGWGFYALTPSGMVQLAMDRVGRGDVSAPFLTYSPWDLAETWLRDRFHIDQTNYYDYSLKNYYYGLFAFVKAMLLHDANPVTPARDPITLLRSSTAGVDEIDWYGAQRDTSLPNGQNNTDGVARTLVGDQNARGYWFGHDPDGTQQRFETAWAIMMLSRSLFESGSPVAVATVTPNPAVAGQTISFSGSSSFHQDGSKSIDSWAWEICKTSGTPIAGCPTLENKTGVVVTSSFGAIGFYQARLTVTDNGVPESSASALVTVNVNTPPLAPTADAGGPYSFCPGTTPWFLDGTGSVNPDDGQSEPGNPPDFIKEHAWDLDGDGQYDDAAGATPDVTAFFTGKGVGSYLIQLRVTDNTSLSFPSSGMGDQADTAAAQVTVRAAGDPACGCIDNLAARAKPTKADLTWSPFPGAASYHVYRSMVSGGPYLYLAAVTGGVYADFGLTNGTTYYWVVRPAALNGHELCQSNQASATPTARAR